MDLTEKDLKWTFDIEKSEEMFLRDNIPLNWLSEHKYSETNVVEREYFVKPGASRINRACTIYSIEKVS